MKVFGIIVVAIVVSGVIAYVGTYNNLNVGNQAVQAQKSLYSSALNNGSQQIEAVWTAANQYLTHESQTFQNVAMARSGFLAAMDSFQAAARMNQPDMVRRGQQATAAALNVNVQIEAYPDLKAIEATKENMRNMESAISQIKTALDDWIVVVKQYNTYRNSFFAGIFGSMMPKFPSEFPYYEGDIQKLDVKSLNPQAGGK
jgi:LemA protein